MVTEAARCTGVGPPLANTAERDRCAVLVPLCLESNAALLGRDSGTFPSGEREIVRFEGSAGAGLLRLLPRRRVCVQMAFSSV